MDISVKKQFSLNLEKCESFIPKREKNFEKEKLNLDLHSLEENDHFLKSEEITRRKTSSDSTNISKIEDFSELCSFPSDSINCPQESPQQTEIFFGRDKNCSHPVYNFYQSTEEYFQENHSENKNYKNTKNFPLKKNFFEKKENKTSIGGVVTNNNNINRTNNINYFNVNQNKTLKNDCIKKMPNLLNMNDGKGKFDMPIYYVGFYGWNSKLLLAYLLIIFTFLFIF
jgi:hypothetical protein